MKLLHTFFILFALTNFALDATNLTEQKRELVKQLYALGAIQKGNFTLKSGKQTNIYFDMRRIIHQPKTLELLTACLKELITGIPYDHICPVPYGAIPMATCLALALNKSMIMPRKEMAKQYGTKKQVEGIYYSEEQCVVIEDVITTGSSILETVETLRSEKLHTKKILVVIDRQNGGIERLQQEGHVAQALFTQSEILSILAESAIEMN